MRTGLQKELVRRFGRDMNDVAGREFLARSAIDGRAAQFVGRSGFRVQHFPAEHESRAAGLDHEQIRFGFVKLGFADAQTLLQSGNVVFSDERKCDALEKLLEAETAKRFKIAPDYFVRTAKEWAEIVAANPFPREATADPGRLVLATLKAAPKVATVKVLQAGIKGREVVRPGTRHLYIYYPEGQGASKFTMAVIERHLATCGTARNWNTVLKLAVLTGLQLKA